MKTFLTPLLACALSAIPSSLFAQFQVGDDFTDPVRDVSKWGAADVGTGDADWVESNGRMNLVAASPSFVGSFVQRQWDGRSPGYSADWQAGVAC